jgi:uncharacterized protein YggT (Ycf19 family)
MPPVGALDFSPIMGFMIISFMEDICATLAGYR